MILLLAAVARAQTSGLSVELPSQQVLGRHRLERAWWSQARLNPSRDSVRHITVDEDNVYVQATSGVVACFKAENGRNLWSAQLGRRDRVSYPAASNENILLVAAGMEVFALEKHSGELLWTLNIARQPSTAPTLDDTNFYIGTLDGAALAFDLQASRKMYEERKLPEYNFRTKAWHYQTARRITSAPVTTGRVVAVASMDRSFYSIAAIGETAGYTNFQFQTDQPVSAAMTLSADPTNRDYEPVGGTSYFVLLASQDGRLYCISMNNGELLWDFQSGRPILRQPHVIGPDVFVTPSTQGMFRLSSATGAKIWRAPNVSGFLAATATRVFGSDDAGNVIILDRASGARAGVLPLRGFSERVDNDRTDRVYLATRTGRVVCIRETGSTIPSFHKFPERQPLVPDFTEEPAAADEADDSQ